MAAEKTGIKFNVTTDGLQEVLNRLKRLEDPIDKTTAELLGDEIVAEMKSLIASGKSPIAGAGNFPKYKDKRKYPGKKKPASPVNLWLTGKFLQALRRSTKKGDVGYDTLIGFRASNQSLKEQGHREGSDGTDATKRPIIPIDGENFVISIRRIIRDVYERRIKFILRK